MGRVVAETILGAVSFPPPRFTFPLEGALPSASESKFQVEGTTVFTFQSRILRIWFMAL